MAESKRMELLSKLLSQSRVGAIDWKPSIREGMFQVSFRDNSLRILLKMADEDVEGTPDVAIQLLNGDGELVEAFTDVELDSEAGSTSGAVWYHKMLELHQLARRRALGVDKVLDEIIAELDGDIPF